MIHVQNDFLSIAHPLIGKSFIICGGRGSTGSQVVSLLNKLGAVPIVLDRRLEEDVNCAVERPIDLSNSLEVKNRFLEIKDSFPDSISGCVCLTAPQIFENFQSITLEALDEKMKNVNFSFIDTFWTAFNPALAAATLMKETGKSGHIVVASSVNALISGGCYGYDGAKAALIPEIANLNRYFAPYGIYFYLMLLGTLGNAANWDSEWGKQWLEKLRKDISDRKLITTQEVALFIAMILGGKLTILSGSPIPCDKAWLITRGLT